MGRRCNPHGPALARPAPKETAPRRLRAKEGYLLPDPRNCRPIRHELRGFRSERPVWHGGVSPHQPHHTRVDDDPLVPPRPYNCCPPAGTPACACNKGGPTFGTPKKAHLPCKRIGDTFSCAGRKQVAASCTHASTCHGAEHAKCRKIKASPRARCLTHGKFCCNSIKDIAFFLKNATHPLASREKRGEDVTLCFYSFFPIPAWHNPRCTGCTHTCRRNPLVRGKRMAHRTSRG